MSLRVEKQVARAAILKDARLMDEPHTVPHRRLGEPITVKDEHNLPRGYVDELLEHEWKLLGRPARAEMHVSCLRGSMVGCLIIDGMPAHEWAARG